MTLNPCAKCKLTPIASVPVVEWSRIECPKCGRVNEGKVTLGQCAESWNHMNPLPDPIDFLALTQAGYKVDPITHSQYSAECSTHYTKDGEDCWRHVLNSNHPTPLAAWQSCWEHYKKGGAV